MKKEDLEKQNEELKQHQEKLQKKISYLEDADKKRRGDISKLFGYNDSSYGYNNTKSKVLEWQEIYFELGKLVESKHQFAMQEILELISIAKDPEILVKLRANNDSLRRDLEL